MAIEKERKFILKDGILPLGLKAPQFIQQGYLMRGEKDHLRVRLINGYTGVVAYKHDINKEERYEFEFGTNKADAEQLMKLAKYKLEKLRFTTTYKDAKVDIDLYISANGKTFTYGLAVVEIEYTTELTTLPDYCGREVTGVKGYSNIYLATNGEAHVIKAGQGLSQTT